MPEGAEIDISAVTRAAQQNLINLNRVIQDIPYGLQGIMNNIDFAAEGFNRLRDKAGGSTEALEAIKGAFRGPSGLLTLLSIGGAAVLLFGDYITQAFSQGTKEVEAMRKAMEGLITITGGPGKGDKLELELEGAIKERDRILNLLTYRAVGKSGYRTEFDPLSGERIDPARERALLKLLNADIERLELQIEVYKRLQIIPGARLPESALQGGTLPGRTDLLRDFVKRSGGKLDRKPPGIGTEHLTEFDELLRDLAFQNRGADLALFGEDQLDPLANWLHPGLREDAMRLLRDRIDENKVHAQELGRVIQGAMDVAGRGVEDLLFKVQSLNDVLKNTARGLFSLLLRVGLDRLGASVFNYFSRPAGLGTTAAHAGGAGGSLGLSGGAGIPSPFIAANPMGGMLNVHITGEMTARGDQLEVALGNRSKTKTFIGGR